MATELHSRTDEQLPDGQRHRAGSGRHRSRSAVIRGRVLLTLLVVLVVAGVVFVAMSQRPSAGRNTGPQTAIAGQLSAASAGDRGATDSTVPSTDTPARTASDPLTPGPATAASPSLQAPVSAPAPVAAVGVPRRLIVAKIHVDTSLQALGLLPDGTLQSPAKWQQAGWFARGTRPGDVGPAVIAGHVDSYLGPAVFFRLRELKTGDDIQVKEAGGRSEHFTVTEVQRFAKSKFPTELVYGPTPLAQLKLITCTGDFDRSKRSYVDNLVVTAVLAPAHGSSN